MLLDTHVLLWWLNGDFDRFSEKMLRHLRGGKTQVTVSAASVWEIAIKSSIGKLEVRGDFPAALAKNRFKELPITFGHAFSVARLPQHHGDPFDRILIAQARAEKMVLVTADAVLHRYDIDTLNPAR